MATNQIKFSIIIPIYNGEKYIDGCLNSIFNQIGDNFSYEIILMIDPSTDNTLEIVKGYASKYVNIRYIEKTQKGVSLSRYQGVKAANNDYIVFVDIDDLLTKDALKTYAENITKYDPDIVSASFFYMDESKNNKITKNKFTKNKIYNPKEALKALFLDTSFRGFLHTKAFKKSLFDKSPLIINNDSDAMFEDTSLMTSLIVHSNKILSKDKETYIYRINVPTSATGKKRTDRLDKHMTAFLLIKIYLETYFPQYLDVFYKTLFRTKWSFIFDAFVDFKNGGINKTSAMKKINNFMKILKNKSTYKFENTPYEECVKKCIL